MLCISCFLLDTQQNPEYPQHQHDISARKAKSYTLHPKPYKRRISATPMSGHALLSGLEFEARLATNSCTQSMGLTRAEKKQIVG